jgi:Iap family predicted aminopeptidase
MQKALAFASLMFLILAACAQSPNAANNAGSLSGEKALAHARAQVAFGPRPPGSQALEKCRAYLIEQLKGFGYQVEQDAFEAATPYGPKKMVNLIASRGVSDGARSGVIVLASHYDTKYMEGIQFVGANDGASSTGLLLELARVLSNEQDDLRFVFLDGEEAFVEWSAFDSTYGSRHLARRWKDEGFTRRIRAFILLDMIGDKDLDILNESHSTPWLRELLQDVAKREGLSEILSRAAGAVEDDHIPFLDAGVPSLDIIDLNYGPGNSFHHTAQDTLDKISAESLEKAGRLVLAMLERLRQKG